MLEAGLVHAKNTTKILTKNVALYAIACTMYMLVGYNIMYPVEVFNSVSPGLSFLLGSDHEVTSVLSVQGEDWYDGAYYSCRADFFFQVVFVATAMFIVSGAVAERMKLWLFLAFCVILTGFLPPAGLLEVGWRLSRRTWLQRLCRFWRGSPHRSNGRTCWCHPCWCP